MVPHHVSVFLTKKLVGDIAHYQRVRDAILSIHGALANIS
jgi:hypothetical protein